MKYIKTIIPLILIISILAGTSISASAISTNLPIITNSDQIMQTWGTGNYSWSQSSSYNMTMTSPYGDTSVLHGIMQGQALQNNTVIATCNSLMQELQKLTNNTSSGQGLIYLLNQLLNKVGTITTSNTILGELYELSSYWGGSTSLGSQKVSSIDDHLYYIKNILGSNSSNSRIRDIANALSYDKLSGTDSYDLSYYIYYLGHSWNKTGATSSNEAYYSGSDWFSRVLEYQSDVVNAVNNVSISSSVPSDLKSGWGVSSSSYPSGYSSSFYEAIRSISRDISTNSSSINSKSQSANSLLTSINSNTGNIKDYSTVLSDLRFAIFGSSGTYANWSIADLQGRNLDMLKGTSGVTLHGWWISDMVSAVYDDLHSIKLGVSADVSAIRNTLANQTDSDIREESSTVINQYNTTFVNGDNGVKASDISNIGSALNSASDLLNSEFDFSSLPQVISDLSSEGLSFWSDDVHSALNPFVGDENE